jgi:hypothetical protein
MDIDWSCSSDASTPLRQQPSRWRSFQVRLCATAQNGHTPVDEFTCCIWMTPRWGIAAMKSSAKASAATRSSRAGEAERARPFRPKVQERSILVQASESACGRGSPRGSGAEGLENERRGLPLRSAPSFIQARRPGTPRNQLAERAGFEPAVRFYSYGTLAMSWYKPLTHLSIRRGERW